MTQTTPTVEGIRTVIKSFLKEITADERLDSQTLERVLAGDESDLTSSDLNQKPETFTENKLIFPVLRALDISFEEQPHGQSGARQRWPDFGTTNIDKYVVGENKPLNRFDEGVNQVKEYLDSISIGANYGIVTDGFMWRIYSVERSGDITEFPEIHTGNLRPAIVAVAKELGYIGSGSIEDIDIASELQTFVEQFHHEQLNQLVSVEAPQFLRERRKRNVEEFYELYIELLFGEGEDYDYETHLLEEIVAPPETPDPEKRRFAVTLMNRLLFIKILETKEVLPDGLLEERLTVYEDNDSAFMRNFYESQLTPLFYDLLNTRPEERAHQYRTGWTTQVPYLNGGLFRHNVKNEQHYTIKDGVLTRIIRDLIEGSEFGEHDNGLDPAILGSVFEMTINFMGGEFGSQEDIGAYYTPDDVTALITEQTVDPRAKEVLEHVWIESASEKSGQVQEYLETLSFTEILEKIEDGSETTIHVDNEYVRIDFGDKDLIETAIEQIMRLTVLDPACGSGHFLTTAMDQLLRIRESLERGLNGSDGMSEIQRYEAKKELALNNIYGVDVDPVGIEIARLRLWLKIIEDGWKEGYGRLPNIELNLVSGNSLVGLPVEQQDQIGIDSFDDKIEQLIDLRLTYKQDDTVDKQEVLEKRDEIRKETNDEFLKRLTYDTTSSVETEAEWKAISESITGSTLYPEIRTVQVKRRDGDELTDTDKDYLKLKGFIPYTKSARIDIERRHEQLKPDKASRSNDDISNEIVSDLSEVLDDGRFEFTEVERQPLACDLDSILGIPFHWVIEFPEVADFNGPHDHTVSFDLIVGNPPYGDILNESEKSLVQWYTTGPINEVSTQFIERQLQLLAEGGYYGNITSLRFVYQSNAYPVHDYMRDKLENIRIACFAHRPEPIFENATVRAAIVSGRKNTDVVADIRTSELLFLQDKTRERTLSSITYTSVEGYLLRNRIGGREREGYEILPKVGAHKEYLDTLKANTDHILEDIRVESSSEGVPNYRKRGGGYWLGYAPKNEWGNLTSIAPIYYESELHRDAAFLLVNSNLYYIFYLAYSNFRNFDFGHIDKFPFPFKSDSELDSYSDSITYYKEKLWQAMLDHPGIARDERFDMKGTKPIINEIEKELIADWFNLTDEQVEYLNNYHSKYGRGSY